MKNLKIIISTVERPNKTPYLDRIIKSIRKDWSGDIHLMIGGKNTQYTDKYKKNYIKHYVDEEGLKNNIQKAAQGYFEALTLDPNNPALIFEDDGELVPGWFSKLETRLSYISEEKFILSLITPGEGTVPIPDVNIPSVQKYVYAAYLSYDTPGYPVSTVITYCNTTGIYYPPSILKTRLAEFIQKFSVNGDAVYDTVVGQYMFRHNLPVYITVPNLLKGVDSDDSSLGHVKRPSTVDYSDWDYTKL